jgi:hypothetical protein
VAAPTPEAASLRAFLSFVDAERTPIERRSVHGFDRLLGLSRRAHRDEAEAARLPGSSVGDDMNVRDLAYARECFTHGFVRGGKRQISDVQTRSHRSLSSRSDLECAP